MAGLGNRIIVLIDMDCFFCQVETKLQPEYVGKPLAVVQYNLWRTGGIIAVNYEARDYGVTRHMRSEEAKERCPDIILATVPPLRGKADTSRYRSAGREVIDVLKKHCNIVERASVDEAYLDLTQIVDDKLAKDSIESDDLLNDLNTTYVVGHSEIDVNNEERRKEGLKTWLSEASEDSQIQRLAVAGLIVENIRKDVFDTTGYKCSAGISFNKILAKLACGLHKPNRQTILPASSVPELFGALPVKKVRHLGGKLGDIVIDMLKCNVMADLLPFSLQQLQNRFDEKTGNWLYNIARGIDNEPVTPRLVSKSIGACKRFPGKQVIVSIDVLKHWLGELSAEICERLEQDQEENERKASLLTLSYHYYNNKNLISQSKSLPLTSYKPEKMTEQCVHLVVKATQLQSIAFLGLSAGKFIKARGSENFMNFFKTGVCDKSTSSNTADDSKLQEETEMMDEDDDDNEETENVENKNETNRMEDECKSKFFTEKTFAKQVKPITPVSKAKVNKKLSPCTSIQKSLKSDYFKKSFFMNILKENQPQIEENNKNVESNEQNSMDGVNSLDMFDEEDDNVEESNIPSTSKESANTNTSSNKVTVELKEIFPDLNDIDPEIVQMLPLHLQQEAKKLLLTSKEKDKSLEENKKFVKESNNSNKEKSIKKSNKLKPKSIQNFFIKTDANKDLKKCVECDQLILVEKFDEHCDYHVAISLQKEMNKTPIVDDNKKRKQSFSSDNQKKRLSEEIILNS